MLACPTKLTTGLGWKRRGPACLIATTTTVFSTCPWPHPKKLDTTEIKSSTGTAGSSYDNILTESIIGPHKAEPVEKQLPRKRADDPEITTAE